jgi:PGF-CTERM protein
MELHPIQTDIISDIDPPVIISLQPENGSKFKEGKSITFFVQTFDEDGDYVNITWTSDGKTIATGESFDYDKLKPGTRVVKVSASDGKTTAEAEVTLIIKKEEESPGFGLVVALAAMVLTGLLVRRFR